MPLGWVDDFEFGNFEVRLQGVPRATVKPCFWMLTADA